MPLPHPKNIFYILKILKFAHHLHSGQTSNTSRKLKWFCVTTSVEQPVTAQINECQYILYLEIFKLRRKILIELPNYPKKYTFMLYVFSHNKIPHPRHIFSTRYFLNSRMFCLQDKPGSVFPVLRISA